MAEEESEEVHEDIFNLDEAEHEVAGSSSESSVKSKRLFRKELRCMMYGFGDDEVPYTESVDLLEDMLIAFINEMSDENNKKINEEDVEALHCLEIYSRNVNEEEEERRDDLHGDLESSAYVTQKAMQIGKKGRVHVEDIVFLIRRDPKKYARVKELLTMNEELKKARKAFDAESYGE
eukprot:gene17381-8976_t